MSLHPYSILAALLLAAAPAAAQSYDVVDLGTLGGANSIAYGVNEAGAVAGQASRANGEVRGFLWVDGVMLNLGTLPTGAASTAADVNAAGACAGWSNLLPSLAEHAVRWGQGGIMDLGTLGGQHSYSKAINARGEIAGWSYDVMFNQYGFLYSGGVMLPLVPLAGSFTCSAEAINNRGVAAGRSYLGGIGAPYHAVTWQSGSVLDLGTLIGATGFSEARDINDLGDVVGTSSVTGGGTLHAAIWSATGITDLGVLPGMSLSEGHGMNDLGEAVGFCQGGLSVVPFLYSNGVMQDLNDLIPAGTGWELQQAYEINDAGDIVGFGTLNGLARGFLLRRDGLRLRGPAPGLAGAPNTLTVSGAPAGAAVVLVYGFAAGSTAVPGCPGLNVQIQSPAVAAVTSAGPSGNASFTGMAPAALSGQTLWMQAVVPSACAVSNPSIHYFP